MTDGWPELLLALAGRIPDDVVAAARDAPDPTDRVARIVAGAQRVGSRLTADDLLGLVEALVMVAEPGDADSAATILDARGDLPLPGYRFRPLHPADDTFQDDPATAHAALDLSRSDHRAWVDPVAVALVDLAAATPGVTAVWAGWRDDLPIGDENHRGKRVFLVEVESGVSQSQVTRGLQRRLVDVGEIGPRVEVLGPETRPTSYQRAVLSAAALLWVPTSTAVPELVATFDGVDADDAPWFDPAHPRLSSDEQAVVAAYLSGAEPLMLTTATMADVLDPGQVPSVPLNFRTDGTYVWPEALAYYADRHGLAPREPLLSAIRSAGYRPPMPGRVQRLRAESVLFGPP